MAYAVRALTRSDVEEITAWRYPPPYDLYDVGDEEAGEASAYFLAAENAYFAVEEPTVGLVGFCCFGQEARVPGGNYSVDALDVGMGMRPSLVGQGRGRSFLGAILAHGRALYSPRRCRVTVAAFNQRSLRVCRSQGFREADRFESATLQRREFIILISGS